MSSIRTSSYGRAGNDHFEPQEVTDPSAQRKLRGHLEQIDYTAFASNREVIAQTLGQADVRKFQRLSVAAANARAQWVNEALLMTESARTLTPEQVDKLGHLRARYQELTEVYEAMRRMVERGYLSYRVVAPG